MLVSRPDVYVKANASKTYRRLYGSLVDPRRTIHQICNFRSLKTSIKGSMRLDKHKSPEKQFNELSVLGRGGFGKVVKAEVEGGIIALKKCMKDESAISEASILLRLSTSEFCCEEVKLSNCPFVAKLMDSFTVRNSGKGKSDELWQVLELCDAGDFSHLMRTIKRPLRPSEIKMVAVQLLLALDFIHSYGVIHRDVKALNLLLNSAGVVKLCDFGAAVEKKSRGASKKRRNMKSRLVSDFWMAPELFIANSDFIYSYEVDIWSFGITVLELSRGAPPFCDLNGSLAWGIISSLPQCSRESQLQQLGFSAISNNSTKSCSEEVYFLESFCSLCLVTDPNKRPRAADLLKENFILQDLKRIRSSLRELSKEESKPYKGLLELRKLAQQVITSRDAEE